MGFLGDVGKVASAAAQVFKSPAAQAREMRLLMSNSCTGYYDLLGDDVLEAHDEGFVDGSKPLWLNLGYWAQARRYPQAAAAKADKVAAASQLGPEAELLDVGFGFGEQDLHWFQHYGPKRIVGVNVTELHVKVARARVEARGLSERIDLRLGSATELPFEAGSFDKVHALECAFHFDTRERFFDEALRVLRPGGRLAPADMLPNVGDDPDSFINRLGLRRWGVPWANIYDRNVYADKLRAHGFVDVRVESIRNHVFPGIGKYSAARNAGKRMDEIEIELSQEEIDSCAGAQTWRTMAASTIT